MKKIKKWLLLLGCILVMFGLCSCSKMEPMVIDTQLKMNSSFDGERIMQTTMDKSVLNTLFDGDTETLRNMIEKYCPSDMGCTVTADGENVKINMVIPFASLSEYKEKVYRILKNDSNPDKDTVNPAVYYDFSNTMFKNGYSVEESFRSIDMFYWLNSAIKTEFPKFTDEDLEGLFKTGTTTLVFNGTSIETGDYIQYTDMESNAFKRIHVYTDLDENSNKYNGCVELTINRSDYDNLKIVSLTDTLKNLVGDDMQLKESITNTEKTYTITFTATSMSQYVRYMNKIFDSDNAVLEITEEKIENEALKARKFVTLYVDSGNYIDFSQPDTEVIYTVNIAGNYTMDACESRDSFIESSNFKSEDNISTAVVHMSADDQITLVLGTDVAVDQIDVHTKVYNQYKIKRHIVFYLTKTREALIGESLTNRIKERLNNYMSFEKETNKDGTAMYKVTISADSAEKMAQLTCTFLDGNSASGLSVMDGGLLEGDRLYKMDMSYNDKIDFSGFMGGSVVENGINYVFEYPQRYEAHFTDASEYENVVEKENVLSCTTYNKTLSIGTSAEKTNWNGIIQMFMWYASLLVILIMILMNLPTIFRCIKTRHINWNDIGLFTHKGYVIVTIFTVAAVVFVITSIRLLFNVY